MLSLIRIFGIATGACSAYKRTGSNQYNAYCKHVSIPPNIGNRTRPKIRFFCPTRHYYRHRYWFFPIGRIFLTLGIAMVNGNVPFLLSIADTNKSKLRYENLEDIVTPSDSASRWYASTAVKTRSFCNNVILTSRNTFRIVVQSLNLNRKQRGRTIQVGSEPFAVSSGRRQLSKTKFLR